MSTLPGELPALSPAHHSRSAASIAASLVRAPLSRRASSSSLSSISIIIRGISHYTSLYTIWYTTRSTITRQEARAEDPQDLSERSPLPGRFDVELRRTGEDTNLAGYFRFYLAGFTGGGGACDGMRRSQDRDNGPGLYQSTPKWTQHVTNKGSCAWRGNCGASEDASGFGHNANLQPSSDEKLHPLPGGEIVPGDRLGDC